VRTPEPSGEVLQRHHEALVEVLQAAHRDGVEMAGLVAEALGEVARSLPGDTEALLAQRPGSWEADLIRRLVNGTIGWPGLRF
jgi:hypothetical protein